VREPTILPVFLLSSLMVGLVAPAPWRAQPQSHPVRLTYTSGAGTYEARRLKDPSNRRSLRFTPATARKLFEFASALDNFQSIDLESHKKVADLGRKTLTYERDGQVNRAEFNYTTIREAQQLTDFFEKIGNVMQHVTFLEFAIKYDHLSLPKELRQIQIDLNNKALAEPELMIPALEEIARNPRFLHLAQVRAQNILARLQNGSD